MTDEEIKKTCKEARLGMWMGASFSAISMFTFAAVATIIANGAKK